MIWSRGRQDLRELLDGPGIGEDVRLRALGEVERANVYFGGNRVVLRELQRALRGWRRRTVRVLDVGTGAGGIAALIREEGRRRGVTVTAVGVDLSHALVRAAHLSGTPGARGDGLALPFRDGSVDVVVCSQLLHHFDRARAITLIRELARVARHRVIVCDLRRSRIAAGGFWLAARALRFHPVTRHDGVVSVLRAFTAAELADLVEVAVGKAPQVRRGLGFRLAGSWAPPGAVRAPRRAWVPGPNLRALGRAMLVACLTLLSVGLLACTSWYIRPTTPDQVHPTPEALARGGYLVNDVASCGLCHTPRVGGTWLGEERGDAFLAGGSVFDFREEGFRVVAPNITQDRETGIGGWTDDEILRAVRDGVGRDGRLLMPPMPFASWQHMSDDDARAIVAYLRTVPPVKNAVRRDHNRTPLRLKLGASLGILHHGPARDVTAPDRADERPYGAYLTKLGLCWECHSLGKSGPSDDEDVLMSGSRRPLSEPEYGEIYARNLTSDLETGLGRYTAGQIKKALRTGRRLDGRPMSPPMSLVVAHVSKWREEDLDALVTYLTSLPPIHHRVPERRLAFQACHPPDERALDALPARLSQTGLYAGLAGGPLAPGVRPFRPLFQLWSDGAVKRRWIWLPPGSRIDTSDMDWWRFPEGTRLWKEFTRDGVRAETRLLAKIGPRDDDWAAVAYVWDDDGSDATARPAGAKNVRRTGHDVPTAAECMACHGGARGGVLGFSAIQLSTDAAPGDLDLSELAALGRLSSPPSRRFEVPGTTTERAALGYLHANCAPCHNPARSARTASRCYGPPDHLDLSLSVEHLRAPAETPAYLTAVGGMIKPGDASGSRLFQLVATRGPGRQMPPLATKKVDEHAVRLLREWINGMRSTGERAP